MHELSSRMKKSLPGQWSAVWDLAPAQPTQVVFTYRQESHPYASAKAHASVESIHDATNAGMLDAMAGALLGTIKAELKEIE